MGAGADLERTPAGSPKLVGMVNSCQPQDSEAGAQAPFGMGALAQTQDRGDQRLGGGADRRSRNGSAPGGQSE